MSEESKINYSIIKAALLKNVVHHEDIGLELWRTNLCLDIQMQIICIDNSTLYEVSQGHCGQGSVLGTAQCRVTLTRGTLNDNKPICHHQS